ncbi:MAG: hypothetical protein QOF48_3766 [Verrucomicrobiota bacterium]
MSGDWLSFSPDWRMAVAFVVAMPSLILVLKIISTAQKRPATGWNLFFWLSFLPSVESLRRVQRAGPAEKRGAFARFAIVVATALLAYVACAQIASATGASGIALGWLGAPLFWLMTEVLGSLLQLLTLSSGWLLPLPHGNIFVSRHLADFWGRRWDVWMSDWFRQVIFLPLRRHPVRAMMIVFVISGIIHELVLNLGLWVVTGHNRFGSMMAYFGIQAVGMLVDRWCLAGCPRLRRIFCWLVVVGPAPLIVNEAALRALCFWRE